jgi:uncharacterized protein YbbK (DUF523 family)/uncharacterized protein YbgA (DUF1722 family)
MKKPKIAVSACLLGQNVRYNGGNTYDKYISDILPKYFEIVPFCPEVEMGMGVPRESVRLTRFSKDDIRMIGIKSEKDWTPLAKKIAKTITESLYDVDGIIFQKKSPSCGVEKVKIYSKGVPNAAGMGIFAETFTKRFPTIPHMDSGRLINNTFKEYFIRQIYAYFFLKSEVTSTKKLQDFHKSYKYIIMEHHPGQVAKLGKICANSEKKSFDKIKDSYKKEFFSTMNIKTTKARKVNVFMHLLGYFKDNLSTREKKRFLDLIDDYKKGTTTYLVVWTMLKHYVEKYQVKYLMDHIYFNPDCSELGLLQYKD